MRTYLSSLQTCIFLVTLAMAPVVWAVSYPQSSPIGEQDGGWFATLFRNMYNPDPLCSTQSGAIMGFAYNSSNLYHTWNGKVRCGFPVASGFTGSKLTIGPNPASSLENDTSTEKALVITGNNASGTPTVLIRDDLRVRGNTYLSGNLFSDGDANFRNIHVRNNLSVSGTTNLTDLNVSGHTTLNTVTVKSGAVFEGNLIMSGGSFRAKKWAPSSVNSSREGYAFEKDGDTGIFAVGGDPEKDSRLIFYLDGKPRMTITEYDGVRIGTGIANPVHWFEVYGSGAAVANFVSNTSSAYIRLSVDNNTAKRIEFVNRDGGDRTALWNPNTGDAFNIRHATGNVGIGLQNPTERLHVQGNARVSGSIVAGASVSAPSFFYTSDARKKKNIVPISSPLQKILTLRGYSFLWKDTNQKDIGLIAQEVELVFPELIGTGMNTDGSTYKTVKYGNLIAPVIGAIGELASKIEAQEQKISDQQQQIQYLIERIEMQDRLIQSLQ